jgi:threonine synthase
MIARGEIQAEDRVVVISTAHGLKFTDFKVRYHENSLPGVKAAYQNPPVSLPPDLDAIDQAIDGWIEESQG